MLSSRVPEEWSWLTTGPPTQSVARWCPNSCAGSLRNAQREPPLQPRRRLTRERREFLRRGTCEPSIGRGAEVSSMRRHPIRPSLASPRRRSTAFDRTIHRRSNRSGGSDWVRSGTNQEVLRLRTERSIRRGSLAQPSHDFSPHSRMHHAANPDGGRSRRIEPLDSIAAQRTDNSRTRPLRARRSDHRPTTPSGPRRPRCLGALSPTVRRRRFRRSLRRCA